MNYPAVFTTFAPAHRDTCPLLYNAIPDQALMEALVDGLAEDSKRRYRSHSGKYKNACAWEGVECEDDGRVILIAFGEAFRDEKYTMEGSLALSNLPPDLEQLEICFQILEFTIDTASLPRRLERLRIMFALQCSGTIDWRRFPKNIKELIIGGTQCSGSVNLTELPKSVLMLSVGRSSFSGTLCLRYLPPVMRTLCLDENKFHGSVTLDHLPSRLTSIMLSNNSFSGKLSLNNLPKSLLQINIQNNRFQGRFILRSPPPRLVKFNAINNQFTGTAVVAKSVSKNVSLLGNYVVTAVDERGRSNRQCLRMGSENLPEVTAEMVAEK